jgi:RNA polymerase sigma-70 factor (ECF subfamily)
MDDTPGSETRVSLLGRLRREPFDEGAWREFVHHYGPKVHGWCRRWGLQEADAQDVTQDVLLKLADKLKTFAYDPARSFRGWLKTLAHHAWSDFLKGRDRPGQGSGDSEVLGRLATVAARDDLVRGLEEQFDHELLEEASCRVRLRVAPPTWEAFRLTAVEGLPGALAAQRTGLQVGQVYVAKHRVEKMLRDEIQKLEA